MSQPANQLEDEKLRLPTTFRALQYRNYRLFFFGQGISLVGTWMQTIALQWLVYRLTGSATMLAAVSLAIGIPMVPMSLLGGSLADRYSKRSILLVTQIVAMVKAFLLAALVWNGAVQVWHVLVLSVVAGLVTAANLPVQQAFLPELVDDRADLGNAIALSSTIHTAARVIGPALAGVAVAAAGEGSAFFVNGITFVAFIAALLLMRLPARSRPPHQPKLGMHLWEAARYVRHHQVIVILISMVATSAFLSGPYLILLPVFAKNELSTSAQPLLEFVCSGSRALLDCQSPEALIYGLLTAANGLGAVFGTLFVASLRRNARLGWWLTLGNLCLPILLLCMALSRSFGLTILLLVGIGYSQVLQGTMAITLVQLNVVDRLRGRVMSFYTLTVEGMRTVGGMQAGVIGDALGAAVAVGTGAVLCLAYGVFVALRYPFVRKMKSTEPVQEDAASVT